MAAKQQYFEVAIPRHLSDDEREELAERIIDHIIARSGEGVGVKRQGRGFSLYDFPEYSVAYMKSLDFKIAGKSASVDLKLSGDMLAAIELLEHRPGKLKIGFREGSEENARAEGNQLGTYGSTRPNPSKARRFLGLTKSELDSLLIDFDDGEKRPDTDGGEDD